MVVARVSRQCLYTAAARVYNTIGIRRRPPPEQRLIKYAYYTHAHVSHGYTRALCVYTRNTLCAEEVAGGGCGSDAAVGGGGEITRSDAADVTKIAAAAAAATAAGKPEAVAAAVTRSSARRRGRRRVTR